MSTSVLRNSVASVSRRLLSASRTYHTRGATAVAPLATSALRAAQTGYTAQRAAYKQGLPALATFSYSTSATAISTQSAGPEGTLEYRLFYVQNGKKISPWHDIPAYADKNNKEHGKVYNFINEIPRGTVEKMEVATDEEHNPIKQDVKKGALRNYKYGPSLVNYGCIPQTWEDPDHVTEGTGCNGDNDPLDVIEIGSRNAARGEVLQVKALGVMALIDDGETDWKLFAIDINDPKASLVNNMADVYKHFPGVAEEAQHWFRMYKTAEGKGENQYGFDDKILDRDFAEEVVEETYQLYNNLKAGKKESKLWLQ
eukprot:GFYU01002905.1.p1 GENE.GFYU01002905.1~~GFYU01002905.1.p1  ORF type:complete len:323 (+),score=116.57 GFYU01002905.1:33-971(+)